MPAKAIATPTTLESSTAAIEALACCRARRFLKSQALCAVPSEASVACSTAVALEWDASFKGKNDPSGRAVAGVHEQAY